MPTNAKQPILPTRHRGGARKPFKDVAAVRVTGGPMQGTYRLPGYPRAGDYRDSSMGDAPIWSIGKALRDMPDAPEGSYFAALDGRFQPAGESEDWKCVWLR